MQLLLDLVQFILLFLRSVGADDAFCIFLLLFILGMASRVLLWVNSYFLSAKVSVFWLEVHISKSQHYWQEKNAKTSS